MSIVIPGYNCSKTIRDTLKACLDQDYPDNLREVIFVDDGSTDQTEEIVRKYPVKYIWQENAGPARARNKGWKEANGEIICFTDADCIPDKDWISSLVKNFEAQGIGAVGGSYGMSNPQNLLASCIHAEIIWRHKRMPRYAKVLGSYNLAIPKKVLQELNGFNETYKTSSGEDNDLCYRLIKKGYKLIFEPEALVYHAHPVKLLPYLRHQFWHGFWRMKLYRDHPSMITGDNYSGFLDYLSPLVSLMIIFLSPFLKINGSTLLTINHQHSRGIDWLNIFWLSLFIWLIFMEVFRTGVILKRSLKFKPIYMFWMLLLRDFCRGLGMFLGIMRFFIFSRPGV